LILGELAITRSDVKGKQFAPGMLILLLYVIMLYRFITLTFLLFVHPIPQVSAVEVMSEGSSLFVWMLLLYVYQDRYKRECFSLSSVKTLLVFYIAKTLQMTIILVTMWSRFFRDVEDGQPEEQLLWVYLKQMPYYGLYCLVIVYVLHQYFTREQGQGYQSLHDAEDPQARTSVYERSSIYNRLLGIWVFPILKIGKRRPIEATDADPLRKVDSSAYNEALFEGTLTQYISRKNDNYALLKAVYRAYLPEILSHTLVCTIGACLDYTGAIFILLLEAYLASDQPLWRGIALVWYMLLCKFLQTVSNSQFRFGIGILGLHLRAGIGSAIYNKGLKVSPASVAASQQPGAEAQFTYAQVTNLMQVDLERINVAIPYAIRVVVVPLQWGIGLYLMFTSLGHVAASSGLGCIILLFVLNFWIAREISKVQKTGMEKRDIRTKAVTELLTNMKVLKLYNWETKLGERVNESREEELQSVRKFLNLQMALIFLNWGSRGYMMMSIIDAISATGSYLTPSEIFAGLSVISVLNMGIRMIPDIISNFMQMLVSMKRIQDYLQVDEVEDNNDRAKGLENANFAIGMKESSFTWAKPHTSPSGQILNTQMTLRNINLWVKKGELVAIVGKVGAGKSSLLESIIGSMNFLRLNDQAYSFVNGSVAYANQVAWIQNTSIRNNILFGNPYDEDRYNEVLHYCRLRADLGILPGGDQTEIGEKGINLSGGQKARVAIARAVYADAEIMLLDDSLSAVDADVGSKIFNDCIRGYCRNKTRVLVTHGQQYLPSCNLVVVMKDGEIIEQGSHQELVEQNGYYVNQFLQSLDHHEDEDKPSSTEAKPEEAVQEKAKPAEQKKIIEAEDRAVGRVGWGVYKTYTRYLGGYKIILGIVSAMVCWQVNRMYADIYLSDWTDDSEAQQDQMLEEHLIIFNIATLTVNIFVLIRLIITFSAGLNAARKLFSQALSSLLNAPINTYYDVTPTGRILNRLTKDQSNVEFVLINMMGAFIGQTFTVALSICICAYVVPYVLILVPIGAFLAKKIQSLYIATSRELTRLGKAYAESISRSPIVQNFSETIAGATIIRAFSYQKQFTERNKHLLDTNSEIFFMKNGCDNWLGIFLELVANLVLTLSGFYIVCSRGSIEAGLAGLTLSYAVTLPLDVNWLILTSSALENSMVSVERLDSLTR
jgi:ABC-type multidrug transport system fused ATPase/permease subunit